MNIARLYEGFLTVGPHLRGGPEAYFADVSQATFITKSCLYNAQTLILDGVVVSTLPDFAFMLNSYDTLKIYRVFVVWQDVWAIAFPMMGWLGQLGESSSSLPRLHKRPKASIKSGSNWSKHLSRHCWITQRKYIRY